MGLLSKDQILQVDDVSFQEVEVPEWGGSVRLKALTAAQRDQFEGEVVSRKGKSTTLNTVNLRARLVGLCLVDEKGERLFSDKDIVELGKKSAIALNRLFEVCQEMNGLTEADVEELEKN